jgi:hypothetical protein
MKKRLVLPNEIYSAIIEDTSGAAIEFNHSKHKAPAISIAWWVTVPSH